MTHHLMNFDNDFPLAIGQDLDGLDMRIEHRPLTFPIAAHLVASVDVGGLAQFHQSVLELRGATATERFSRAFNFVIQFALLIEA